MEYTQLGTTSLQVSRIALGTWAMGGWLWGGTDVEAAVRAIHEALDLGITTIDTAAVYGFGLSEEIVARALREKGVPRDRVVIATKCGMEWDEQENVRRNSSPQRIRKEVEDSLRRLQTDYIDLYQVHWPDPDVPIQETARVLSQLHAEGKVRAIGVSNYGVGEMQAWREVAPLHSDQPPYSLLRREIEADVLPYAREHGIAILAYSPLARGLLTGKFTAEASFPPGDSRAQEKRFQGEEFQRNLRRVEHLKALAAELGKSAAQLAVRWVLDQPGVTVALWGARRPGQIAEAAGATGWHLTDDVKERIERIMRNEAGAA
ncbi:aldo/keto reductase [Limnochorda pilosa]|uniref:General stress protein n=1 Tax=Limnochorda pilosa TaxID=1555112 RepID=A0A0K2SHM5_LIMPI|nr:aldo/keto reductase [Limnochorda pilosa]BAS26537.1 general stress protein [Limnochorda pilosa]